MPLFGFLRGRRQSSAVMPVASSEGADLSLTPRPHTSHAPSKKASAASAPTSPSLDQDRTPTQKPSRKRKMPPLESGRTAEAVQRRWEHDNDNDNNDDNDDDDDERSLATPKQPKQQHAMGSTCTMPTPNGNWISKLKRLSSSFRADFIHVKREENDDVDMAHLPPHALPDHPVETVEHDVENSIAMADNSIVVTSGNTDSGSEDDSDGGFMHAAREKLITENKNNNKHDDGSSTEANSETDESEAGDNEYADSDEDEFDDNDADIVEEDWEWLFETEPPEPDAATAASDTWSVDGDELAAYEEGVASIEGYADGWTADEKRLHRLLALRGFHPLLPGNWMRDFLGVPMYPYLFAPLDEDDDGMSNARRVTITNYGSQFHATKALRALFDLQARVSGLRQTGHNTARIGAIIEREVRRYISWAAVDAGLDQCGPLAAMPNIAAKQFLVGAEGGKRGRGQKKQKPLARRVQEFFGDWVARYRSFYATLPEYEVEGSGGTETRRLRPPRLLYGFVIVQHAVMLMVVDASAPESGGYERFEVPATATEAAVRKKRRRHPHPRCLADFNLSHGDRWLDASLNVAIPVHVARAAQLRCRAGLVLPSTRVKAVDDDA